MFVAFLLLHLDYDKFLIVFLFYQAESEYLSLFSYDCDKKKYGKRYTDFFSDAFLADIVGRGDVSVQSLERYELILKFNRSNHPLIESMHCEFFPNELQVAVSLVNKVGDFVPKSTYLAYIGKVIFYTNDFLDSYSFCVKDLQNRLNREIVRVQKLLQTYDFFYNLSEDSDCNYSDSDSCSDDFRSTATDSQ